MTIEGLAAVQARIDAITWSFRAPAPAAPATSRSFGASDTSVSFADTLSRAQGHERAAATMRGATPFLDAALRQAGDRYLWGAETTPTQADPTAFDCSELVQWAAAQAGASVPDGSWNQYLDLARRGGEISVEQALRTPGALLFRFSDDPKTSAGRPSQAHVAISLGDGRTIEARGSRYGVGVFDATGRHFTHAAVIPGTSEATPSF